MSDNAVVVFTVEGLDTIRHQGGTQYWILNRTRARESEFVILVQNRIKSEVEHKRKEWKFATADKEHGTAFLIGRIADIVRTGSRWLIKISEYSEIDIPEVWKGWRFPVRYMPLSDLGIDPKSLTFKPLFGAKKKGAKTGGTAAIAMSGATPLTIAEAKHGLAAGLGVSEKNIEITIRG
jgi:hypothetical protein